MSLEMTDTLANSSSNSSLNSLERHELSGDLLLETTTTTEFSNSNASGGDAVASHDSSDNLLTASSTSSFETITNEHEIDRKKSLVPKSLSLRSYSKWAPYQQGATLVWRDVCVYANRKGNSNESQNTSETGSFKRIINNANGAILPGTLMALMGSSGSGKSTLMAALAYRNSIGTIVQGDILLNGRRVGPFMHRISGFVHQEDLFIGTLTVYEHISFMAHMKLDRRISRMQKRKLIYDLLDSTGLTNCINNRIGEGDDGKILSGGEKKRLAFATELLSQPTILFCDEPTSGLDSYSAQQLVRTLQKLAKLGTTIICTIHQPSSQLFAMFHEVLLLAEGRIAFMGTPNQALDFFASYGYSCPDSYNPADFLIGVLSNGQQIYEKSTERSVNRLCDLYAVSSVYQQREMLVNFEVHMSESAEFDVLEEETRFCKPFWPITIFWLFYRSLLTVVRNPTIQKLRIIQKFAIALMAGLCFFGSINLSQQGVQSVQGVLFILISENTFPALYSVLNVFPQAFPLFLREKRSGLYDSLQYYVANILAMLPGLIVEPLLFVIVLYWLAGLRATFYAFFMTALISILVMNVASACGFFFSTAFETVPMAMAYLIPFDYILMLTSGNFIKLNTLSIYLGWLKYLSWFMYANESMSIIQWNNVENITCYQEDAVTDLPCLHSGQEVLNEYNFSISNLSRNIWTLVILYAIFNALAFFFLWKRARKL